MAVTIPASFVARQDAANRPGENIDTPDAQEAIENANWLLVYRRRQHGCHSYQEGDITGGAATYRVLEDTLTAYGDAHLVILVRLGHATNPGVRLRYLLAAVHDVAAANGEIEIKLLGLDGTLYNTTAQAITQGATEYYVLGPTARVAPDTEYRIEVRLKTGQATKSLALLQFTPVEAELALADIP